MEGFVDRRLEALFGSRTRLLTLAALASSDEPLTGYRVAELAGLPRPKVYAELDRGCKAGLVVRSGKGFELVDQDVRRLLQKRVRLRWDEEWDRARFGWSEETLGVLKGTLVNIRSRIRADPNYLRPSGWRPPRAAALWSDEIGRPKGKDIRLTLRGLRSSKREDWTR